MTTRDTIGNSGFKGRTFYSDVTPLSPKEGDLWIEIDPNYLTEIERWCWTDQYSPAIWQSASLKQWLPSYRGTAAFNLYMSAQQIWVGYDIVLGRLITTMSFSVAQTSSNYWTINLQALDDASNPSLLVQKKLTSVGTVNSIQQSADDINNVYKHGITYAFVISGTPTGTAGTISYSSALNYRHIKN